MHPLFLVPALLGVPAQAQDVLVPEFTPVIAEDFTLAYMFYSLVIDELRQQDVAFVDGDELRRIAGSEAEACSESITCPSGLWTYFPSTSIAIVGTVGLYNMGTAEESIEVRVDFYERDGYQPFKSVERQLVPGQETDFAVALAKATRVLVDRGLSTPEPEPVEEPERGPEGRRSTLRGRASRDEEPEPEDSPQDELYKSYYQVDEPEEDRRSGRSREPRDRDAGKVSTRPPREPREKKVRQPRDRPASSGDASLLRAQAFAGLAIGDVARSYDVRLSVMGSSNSQLGRYEHDSFTGGVGSTLGVGLMVAPTPWLQAGARLGVVTGRKFLSTGYERWEDGDMATAEIQDYKPAAAMRGLIEPRVAVAPLAFGAFRPSVHGFFGLRRYDAYAVADLEQLDFPARNGGWQLVPGAGLGVVYDLGSGRGVGLELSHAVSLGSDDVHHVQQGLVTEYPAIPAAASRTTTITVGFTQGFM
jgi:hypothetical protein